MDLGYLHEAGKVGGRSRPSNCIQFYCATTRKMSEDEHNNGRHMIRVATYNVHSFTDSGGRPNFDHVKRIVGESGVDVLCLQEAGKVGTAGRGSRRAGVAGGAAAGSAEEKRMRHPEQVPPHSG